MKRFEQRFEPWDPVRFALLGAAFGMVYGFAMGAVMGIYTLQTVDLLVWGVTSTVLFGAAVAGGIAVLRNHLADLLTKPREERPRKPVTFAAVLRPLGL